MSSAPLETRIDAGNDADVQHLRSLVGTVGFEVLVRAWNVERERIIQEGKKARADNKQTQMWSKLDGFDLAATMLERVIKSSDLIANLREEEDV